MIDALEDAISPWIGVPYILFGHSMGALLAFEVARRFRKRARPMPACLIVAGYGAPQLQEARPALHLASDTELIEEMRKLGGTSEEALRDPELMELVLPPFRADCELLHRWSYLDAPPLPMRLWALGGANDEDVPPAMLEAWRAQTSGEFASKVFEGDHFFVQSQRAEVLARVSAAVAPLIA